MSIKRSRRQNAGNKLQTMIDEERAKIDSGEVVASDEDEEFIKKADVDDVVDSDFEETDSEVEHAAEDASKEIEALIEKVERRKRRKQAKKRIIPRFASTRSHLEGRKKKKKDAKEATPADASTVDSEGTARQRAKAPEFAVRFSSRASAVRKAQETEALEHEREMMAAIKRNPGSHAIQPIEPSPSDSSLQNARSLHTEYRLENLDESRYPLNPWAKHLSILPPTTCPVTGLPAKYMHPRAKVPYANVRAYRILEELIRGEHALYYDIGIWNSTKHANGRSTANIN
ncbi:hypothetical protein GGI12_000357 [Dipsacomyces acuminosporus]|nr:hypothetical protein GGI12_000357 [Dipsacomyces acuminosporus]